MIRVLGFEFNENQKITKDDILRCHPQMSNQNEERFGVPLRVTSGYQCIYDNTYRNFRGLIFYAPAYVPKILKVDEQPDLLGPPLEILSYVLASYDGTLKPYKDGMCLVSGEKTMVYRNINIIKSSGQIKKGGIIGTVKKVPNGYGYGVEVIAYKDGKVWNLQQDLYNINCLE